MSIESVIQNVREAVSEHRSIYLSNEQAVRDTLINPLLDELGWNTKNLKFVMPNAPNEDGKIPDYILLKNDKRMLVVEAKNMSIELGDSKTINQIASYCYGPGIKFGLLTNGGKWLLFNTFQPNPSERIVWKLDFLKDEMQDILRKLSCITYECVEQIEQLSAVIRSNELLENTWQSMVPSKESAIDILRQFIQQRLQLEHPSVSLDSNTVKDFIGKKFEMLFRDEKGIETCIAADEVVEEDDDKEHESDYCESNVEHESGDLEKTPSRKKSKLRVKVRVTFPDKTTIFSKKVADVFVETIKKIGPENVKKLGIHRNGIPIVSDKKDVFYGDRQKLIPPNFYIMTNSSTKDKIQQLHEINKRLNLGMRIEEILPDHHH